MSIVAHFVIKCHLNAFIQLIDYLSFREQSACLTICNIKVEEVPVST